MTPRPITCSSPVRSGTAGSCIESGRLDEAEPWLRQAGARAQARDWKLATARARLERGAAAWAAGQYADTQDLVTGAAIQGDQRAPAPYPAAGCAPGRSRVGLDGMGGRQVDGARRAALAGDRASARITGYERRADSFLFRGAFGRAVAMVEEARSLLDSSPRHSWLQYARLDAHLWATSGGPTRWRRWASTRLGKPGQSWEQVEARRRGPARSTVVRVAARYRRGMVKLNRAADLKIPAALAVDSVRYTITDAGARARWASGVSAPLMAGAFAVAWESDNTELTCELIEYHSARGTFSADRTAEAGATTPNGPKPPRQSYRSKPSSHLNSPWRPPRRRSRAEMP